MCFASSTVCLASHGSHLDGGGRSNSLVCSVTPLSFHGRLQAAGALMAFKCLTRARTIPIGLVLSRKEDRGILTSLGGSYWGEVSRGGFGTHQDVALARVPLLLPRQLACSQRVPRNEERRWGRRSPRRCPRTGHQNVVVCTWVGKEFPDTRQNVKKIEFISGKGHCQNSGPTTS